MPKVTVLMSVYNGARFLREAIESILGQTFGDFEFLIVDDGSTDDSREMILSYRDPRVRLVINDRNVGLPRSLNRGLGLAQGEYVARQDADDISESPRLAKQVAFLDAYPDVSLLGTWYRKIDERGRIIGDRQLPCDHVRIRWCQLFFCPFVHAAVMIRKSPVLERVGLYDETLAYAQDHEFWIRIARRLPVANLNEVLVRYRVQPWSLTATSADAPWQERGINVAIIARMLGWAAATASENERQFLSMYALLYGSLADLTLEDARMATGNIVRLHTIFCRNLGLDRETALALRAELRAHVRRRLRGMASRYLRRGKHVAALRLVGDALRLRGAGTTIE